MLDCHHATARGLVARGRDRVSRGKEPHMDFTGKTVKELRQLCKDRGIKGHSRDGITRAGLVTLLEG